MNHKEEFELFRALVESKPFKARLDKYLASADGASSALASIWAGLIATDQEDYLLQKGLVPAPDSKTIMQILFKYCTDEDRAAHWEQKMKKFEALVSVQPQGPAAIVKDIEAYAGAYSKVFVDFEAYPFVTALYSRYSADAAKIYYILAINQLKFYESFQKSAFDLKLLPTKIEPLLLKIRHTKYWARLKKIKFAHSLDASKWQQYLLDYEASTVKS